MAVTEHARTAADETVGGTAAAWFTEQAAARIHEHDRRWSCCPLEPQSVQRPVEQLDRHFNWFSSVVTYSTGNPRCVFPLRSSSGKMYAHVSSLYAS